MTKILERLREEACEFKSQHGQLHEVSDLVEYSSPLNCLSSIQEALCSGFTKYWKKQQQQKTKQKQKQKQKPKAFKNWFFLRNVQVCVYAYADPKAWDPNASVLFPFA